MNKIRKEVILKLANELGYNLSITKGHCILNNETKIIKKNGFAKAYQYLYHQKRYLEKKNKVMI